MAIFAISDLHLPGGDQKPMAVFGAHWADHFERISEDWRRRVTDADIVLIPGDISWAMYLADALEDLRAIAALPGRTVLLRGNHDYWWHTISKLRAALPEGMFAIQNDALVLGQATFCGTRGWLCPGETGLGEEDERIHLREVARLKLSLQDARRRTPTGPLVALTHYPPWSDPQIPSPFTKLFTAYGVAHVVYGHLHGAALRHAFSGLLEGVRYHQVSCDGLHFQLCRVCDDDGSPWEMG